MLIAGAGPAGLAAAATLALHGVPSLVVERRAGPSTHPRATTASTRTMELLRGLGAEDDVLPHAVDVDWLLLRTPTMARADEGVAVEIGLPTRAQAALISPAAPACVAQDRLERALVGALRRGGVGEVWFGAELTRFTVRADGVRAMVRTADGVREVRARHLVAADGARSAVRAALGIPMHGSDDVLGAVTALFRAPLWDVVGDRRFGIYATMEPGAEGTFLPWAPGDRWGFGVLVDVSGGAPAAPSADEMLRRLRRAAGVPDLPVEVERVGWFTSAARVAERFREGPVFLTGDAAHRVTPRGGTGMNTAFADGHDLGWRLAWVHRGWAVSSVLDGYEAERRPVAEHNVARSADPDGSARAPGEELRIDLGGRIAHHWLADGRSTLDLPGPGLTVVTGPEDGPWRAAAAAIDAGPMPVAVEPVDALTARALAIRPGGAVLLRPDGVPLTTWPSADHAPAHLAAATADATGRVPSPRRDLSRTPR
ncbi:MAG TPA: FAD-dependent monooxygenase [Miltoncostaea sp.]|nr:FAD-dependent monooxygenase [Miltoncostaea sp.]